MGNIGEAEMAYGAMTDAWRAIKERGARALSVAEWESLLRDADSKAREWGRRSEDVGLLYRDLMQAVSNYYERKGNTQETLLGWAARKG